VAKTLIARLKKTAGLRGWQVSSLKKQSTELYFVGRELETVRCNSVADYTLRIQTPADMGFMGESTSRFQGRPDSLSQLIESTRERAMLVKNPAFNFSQPYSPKAIPPIFDETMTSMTLDSMIAWANDVQNYREKNLPRCNLNSLEIFFENFDYRIENMSGLEVGATSTRVVCDYVLTSPDNNHEIMGIKKRRFLADLNMNGQLDLDARILYDLEDAVLPPTGNFPVLLSGEALDSLFDFFVAQLDGHALFNRYSLFKGGDAIVRDAKEALTLKSVNDLSGGMQSYAFDDLGFETKNVTLVENSRVKNFLIDGRHADLLKMPQTSALMNIEVEPGRAAYDDFITDGVLELSKFSTFQPNTISGAFSGEIRLGYLHKNGRRIPVKGGSVSGMTQTAFAAAFKSRETEKRSAYLGPKGIFFESLTIAGE